MVSEAIFEELLKKGFSLDLVYLLQRVNYGFEYFSPKIELLMKTLIRKGLITEQYKITLQGEELLKFVNSSYNVEEKPILIKKKSSVDIFESWWIAYPGTDSFTYKGKIFYGTRALKVKKNECKIKLEAILNEGDYKIEDLIGALEIEVFQKKENSIKTGQNKLSFQQNSLTYLNQRTWEPFIELFRAGHKVIDIPQNYEGVNI